MSFLGGPECSTAANPLAQFQKQTAADTSLQRDRLTSRQPQQFNGFRSQPQVPEDAAFQDFAHQGPPQMGMGEDAFHFEQMRRETERLERMGGGGGGAWAGEFAGQQGPPQFAPERFAQEQQQAHAGGGVFTPQDFAQFRQSQMSPVQRNQSPAFQQSSYTRPMGSMYGGGGFGMGMQRPMFSPTPPQGFSQQEYAGKGKERVQELSDTDWERQFEELSTADQEALDREAEKAMEEELNGIDR